MKIIKTTRTKAVYKDNVLYLSNDICIINRKNITDLDLFKDYIIHSDCIIEKASALEIVKLQNPLNRLKIKSKDFYITVSIQYTDINKCNPEYAYIYTEVNNHKECFDKYAMGVRYVTTYNKNYNSVKRYECYGEFDTTLILGDNCNCRNELESTNKSNIYNLGDIVSLKYPLEYGIAEGIITKVVTEDDSPMYTRLYEVTSKDGICLWDDNMIAYTDIDKKIGHNIKLAYEYAKNIDGVPYSEYCLEKLKKESEK